jgi:predicted hydrocarbon binding protein
MQEEQASNASILKLSMQTLKEHYGLNPGKYTRVVRGIGSKFGYELAHEISSTDLDGIVDELSRYWVQNGIGEMSWADRKENSIKITNCSDCLGRSYGAGFVLCPFKEGLLESVLQTKISKNYRVKELECCGTLAPACLFKITRLS